LFYICDFVFYLLYLVIETFNVFSPIFGKVIGCFQYLFDKLGGIYKRLGSISSIGRYIYGHFMLKMQSSVRYFQCVVAMETSILDFLLIDKNLVLGEPLCIFELDCKRGLYYVLGSKRDLNDVSHILDKNILVFQQKYKDCCRRHSGTSQKMLTSYVVI